MPTTQATLEELTKRYFNEALLFFVGEELSSVANRRSSNEEWFAEYQLLTALRDSDSPNASAAKDALLKASPAPAADGISPGSRAVARAFLLGATRDHLARIALLSPSAERRFVRGLNTSVDERVGEFERAGGDHGLAWSIRQLTGPTLPAEALETEADISPAPPHQSDAAEVTVDHFVYRYLTASLVSFVGAKLKKTPSRLLSNAEWVEEERLLKALRDSDAPSLQGERHMLSLAAQTPGQEGSWALSQAWLLRAAPALMAGLDLLSAGAQREFLTKVSASMRGYVHQYRHNGGSSEVAEAIEAIAGLTATVPSSSRAAHQSVV